MNFSGAFLSRLNFLAGSLGLLYQKHSQLIVLGDKANWVLNWEVRELLRITQRIGIPVSDRKIFKYIRNQAIYLVDQFHVSDDRFFQTGSRVGVSYFHGRLFDLDASFNPLFKNFKKNRERISAIQVSNLEFKKFLLNEGFDKDTLFHIPIPINISFFPFQTRESKIHARRKFKVPQSAVTVGSFQKDGSGWGEGSDPKIIKGPDVFVESIRLLRERVKELFVVLSGPSRGYVKKELAKLGIPFTHVYVNDYREVGDLFQLLDLYIVSSREEGGPKAVLESMASGVPLVSTRVGQASDIVEHGKTGWLANVEDADALAHWSMVALGNSAATREIVTAARLRAEEFDYACFDDRWKQLFSRMITEI